MAPELPEEINASASPSLTNSKAFTREESFLVRIALTGFSDVSITSLASTISNPAAGSLLFLITLCICGLLPTKMISKLGSFSRALTAQLIGSSGA